MPFRFIRKGGRTIPIGVSGAAKNAADAYSKHFGADKPLKKISHAKLFNTVKTKSGFIGYAIQRASKASVQGTAKGLRAFGRGHMGVGALAAVGTGTVLFSAAKALRKRSRKPTEGM